MLFRSRYKIGIPAVIIFVLAIIFGWPGFGMTIYDKCMTVRVDLLSTKAILENNKDKTINYFARRILANNARQNELISILKNEGDTLSTDELWTVLYYLQRNKDPIILKYAIKLGKNRRNGQKIYQNNENNIVKAFFHFV